MADLNHLQHGIATIRVQFDWAFGAPLRPKSVHKTIERFKKAEADATEARFELSKAEAALLQAEQEDVKNLEEAIYSGDASRISSTEHLDKARAHLEQARPRAEAHVKVLLRIAEETHTAIFDAWPEWRADIIAALPEIEEKARTAWVKFQEADQLRLGCQDAVLAMDKRAAKQERFADTFSEPLESYRGSSVKNIVESGLRHPERTFFQNTTMNASYDDVKARIGYEVSDQPVYWKEWEPVAAKRDEEAVSTQ